MLRFEIAWSYFQEERVSNKDILVCTSTSAEIIIYFVDITRYRAKNPWRGSNGADPRVVYRATVLLLDVLARHAN